MTWYHKVASAGTADPSYRGGMELQLRSHKEKGEMERYPQPQQSSTTWPLWNAPTFSYSQLSYSAWSFCSWLLVWFGFFLQYDNYKTFGTGFPAYKTKSYIFLFLPRYRIGPFEVESALIEHPAVAEAAVVSSPDALRGEVMMLNRAGGEAICLFKHITVWSSSYFTE